MHELQAQFGDIDIYLFDQILRGRIPPDARIFDAGCGWGRNLTYLLRAGHHVLAADSDPSAVEAVRRLARTLAAPLPADNFRVESIESTSFPDRCVDVVISSAVLHFAKDHAHFEAMLHGSWRVLDVGGVFFCRLASSTGIERQVREVGSGRYHLPDGSERYLVSTDRLMDLTARLGGTLLDPIKTTVVHNQRAMTTWVVRKNLPQ
jgi:SAM-dependent methyltransferase